MHKNTKPFLLSGVLIGGFFCRLWLAHTTFLNTDEAWHFSVANQTSLSAAYKASLTLAHPPLLVFVLYFWRQLGTSDAMLRLPGVLASSLFCWVFYEWLVQIVGNAAAFAALILACFLPPMIALSAELRQYSLMLLFAVSAAYLLEQALSKKSAAVMLASCGCLYFAMLSHYSAFLLGAALGVYAIARMSKYRSGLPVSGTWAAGQVLALAGAAFLYRTHISKLGSVYPVAQPLQRFGDFYLSDWYFHPGRDRLLPFLYRGTFGVFRFIFGHTGVGQIAALLFVAGVLLLAAVKTSSSSRVSSRCVAILLVVPFLINWIAVISGLYPYGRTRQCMFLVIFVLTGVGFTLARIANNAAGSAGLAALVVLFCQAFGTQQGRDMLPLSEQRHEHMDQAIQFIRQRVSPEDVILTDKATSFQLKFYLCDQKPVEVEHTSRGYETFQCSGLRVVSTSPDDGALTADVIASHSLSQDYGSKSRSLWVVQGGWASGLGEELRDRFPAFSQLQIHSFGRHMEVFRLSTAATTTPQP